MGAFSRTENIGQQLSLFHIQSPDKSLLSEKQIYGFPVIYFKKFISLYRLIKVPRFLQNINGILQSGQDRYELTLDAATATEIAELAAPAPPEGPVICGAVVSSTTSVTVTETG